MSALRKTLVYLGLAEEDVYDDFELAEDPDAEFADDQPERRSTRESVAELRPESRGATVTRLPSAVRSAGELQRITAVHPRTYNDAKVVGEHFRDGVPVIMNLTDMSDTEAKRLVDFAAGLVFGLHGAVERVTNKVFLLSPAAVEVHNEKQQATPAAGFFNQA